MILGNRHHLSWFCASVLLLRLLVDEVGSMRGIVIVIHSTNRRHGQNVAMA